MNTMSQWTPLTGLKDYSRVLARKMGFIALAWIVVYFISQPFRSAGDTINVLVLFAPMIGSIAGLVAGWYMATDSVEDSGWNGIVLWTVLVIATILPMWVVEGIMHLIFRHWVFGFGGWMLLSSAMLIALATCVWHASSQE